MIPLNQQQKLTTLARALIDQKAARILIEPQDRSTGFWFGGGNVIQDRDGSILICGRYRNYGDSRTGVGAGERGLELAVFRACQRHLRRRLYLAHRGMDIVSIEGVALHLTADGIELYLSTEKDVKYPERLHEFQKPGAGVWSIDRIVADTVTNLSPSNLEEIIPFGSDAPERLHCKDPWVFDLPSGDTILGYCTHPFTWSSSGTAMSIEKKGCTSCTWLTRTVPPSARPRYQAKNPIHIENTAT